MPARPAPCLIALASLLVGASAQAQSRPPIVSAIDVHPGPSPVPVAIGGRRHLAYELHITNVRPSPVTLMRLEVVHGDRDMLIHELSDAALRDRIGRVGPRSAGTDTRIIEPGMRAIVYLWVPLDPRAETPARLQHRIALEVERAGQRLPLLVTAGVVEVRTAAPMVLEPPVRGGPWVALYDPLLMGGHRTAVYAVEGQARIPARFAIDFVRLERDGSPACGDRSEVANWHGYGADVLAVAGGIIIDAKDDMPEPSTLAGSQAPIPLENASGNFVTLDLGGGRFAFYEHLKHGSVRVRPGDRVKAGDVLGALGNSGSSSSGPHLHFHLADARAELAGEGVPFVFRAFEVVGAYGSIDAFATGTPWEGPREGTGGTRHHEFPSPISVVMFDAGLAQDSAGPIWFSREKSCLYSQPLHHPQPRRKVPSSRGVSAIVIGQTSSGWPSASTVMALVNCPRRRPSFFAVGASFKAETAC